MIEFLGLPPFMRIALPVAMETMHFHKAQPNLFLGQLVSHLRAPDKQFGTHEKLS